MGFWTAQGLDVSQLITEPVGRKPPLKARDSTKVTTKEAAKASIARRRSRGSIAIEINSGMSKRSAYFFTAIILSSRDPTPHNDPASNHPNKNRTLSATGFAVIRRSLSRHPPLTTQ